MCYMPTLYISSPSQYTPAVSLEPLPSAIEGDWLTAVRSDPADTRFYLINERIGRLPVLKQGNLVEVRSFGRFLSFTGIA